MDTILNIIKKIIPKKILNPILPSYHKIMANIAAFFYGHPSEKMIVIGVTGTNGKSTTTEFIARALACKGIKSYAPTSYFQVENCKVGFTSTVKFKVGDKEWLNDKKMTMVGRFQLQKLLRDMVKAGCKYAVIETSSEGVKQFRHKGINYDYLVFTNLTPEHIESHGSFERYKEAKLRLFDHLSKSRRKVSLIHADSNADIRGTANDAGGEIEKVIIVNGDDKYANEFLNFNVDKKIIYGVDSCGDGAARNYRDALQCVSTVAENIKVDKTGTYFEVAGTGFKLNMLGKFNVYNALPAIIIGQNEGMEIEDIKDALEKVKGVPGRMEFIEEGQDFLVLIDYAPEPGSMEKLYETVREINTMGNTPLTPLKRGTIGCEYHKIIHVLGSCGGGRDKTRRPVLGRMAAENADIVIITNEDPYDDDPMEVINEVAAGAISIKQENKKTKKQNGDGCGGILGRDGMAHGKIPPNPPLEKGGIQKVFKILDRREAIRKALELAKAGDLVLITGKGSEQAICVADGKKIPWDDREVVREEISRIMKHEAMKHEA